MKVKRREYGIARILKLAQGSRLGVVIRSKRQALPAIIIAFALWASAVIAIAEYWRSEVPVVRAVGTRATANRVLHIK